MTVYTRNCPICNDEIEYTNKRSWYNANKSNASCKPCWRKKLSDINKEKVKNGTFVCTPRDKDREKDLDRPYVKTCPECGVEMRYTMKKTLQSAISKNTICNSCSSYKYNKTWNNVISDEHIKQMRASKAGFDSWDEYKKKYPKKQFYKREVWRLTYQNDLQQLQHWEKRGRCGVKGAYQLDHIVSINEGWEKGIDPQQIAQWDNLRMIPWKQNRQKGG